jgi:hypothetical protein
MLEVNKIWEEFTNPDQGSLIKRYYRLTYFGWDVYKGLTVKYTDDEIEVPAGTLLKPQWVDDPEQPAFVRKYLIWRS